MPSEFGGFGILRFVGGCVDECRGAPWYRTRSDNGLIATVAYMVNSGRVRLCGNFKGARFELDALTGDVAA